MPVLSAPLARNAARPWATAIFPRPGQGGRPAGRLPLRRPVAFPAGLLGVFRTLPSRPREAGGVQLHKQRRAAASALCALDAVGDNDSRHRLQQQGGHLGHRALNPI